MTTVTSMGIMPVASSGAILMPWVIGKVAESAGLAAGMATNIVPPVWADHLWRFGVQNAED